MMIWKRQNGGYSRLLLIMWLVVYWSTDHNLSYNSADQSILSREWETNVTDKQTPIK